MTHYITVRVATQNPDALVTAYYGLPKEGEPMQKYGTIWAGEVFKFPGIIRSSRYGDWIMFTRANGVTLYAPRYTNTYSVKPNTMREVAVELVNPQELKIYEDEISTIATLFDNLPIRKTPDNNDNPPIMNIAAGTVLHVVQIEGVGDPNDKFVKIKYRGRDGVDTFAYFDMYAYNTEAIEYGSQQEAFMPLDGLEWDQIEILAWHMEDDDPPVIDSGESDDTTPPPASDPDIGDPALRDIMLTLKTLILQILAYKG